MKSGSPEICANLQCLILLFLTIYLHAKVSPVVISWGSFEDLLDIIQIVYIEYKLSLAVWREEGLIVWHKYQ